MYRVYFYFIVCVYFILLCAFYCVYFILSCVLKFHFIVCILLCVFLFYFYLFLFRANFLLHFTSRPFSRLSNYFLSFLFMITTMTKSYFYRSTDGKRSSSSPFKFQRHPYFPVLHSLDVLLSFFLVLYLSISLLLLPLTGNGCHSFSDMPPDYPCNLTATISCLTNSNITLLPLVTISPCHCNFLSYSLRSLVSCTSCTSSILSHRVSTITIVPYLFSDLSFFPITFYRYANPTVSHHHLHKYRNLFLFLLLVLGGDVERNPGPISVTSNLNLAHLNIRSASSITDSCNKPLLLQEFISENSIDVLSLTETWLSPDTPPSVLNSLTPPNFSILHHPRPESRGGGIALIYRSFLKASKIPIPACSSFEAFCMQISFSNFSCSILSVYRPPALSKADVLSELTTLLEILVPSSSELVITGDFNNHLKCSSNQSVSQFLSLLDMFDLKQLVNFPTHNSGHTLDLFIKRCVYTLMSDIDFGIHPFTDYHSIHSVMNGPRFNRSHTTKNKFVQSSPSILQLF